MRVSMQVPNQLQLLGTWSSPFSKRVEIGLKLKGVKYDFLEEDVINKGARLLEMNPVHKKVPVLVVDGKPICESLLILEYLDETWEEQPLLPRDPYHRAVARFWAKFIDDKCIPGIWQVFATKGDPKAIEEITQHLKTLENELKGNKFFGGHKIGHVDIAASYIAFWLLIFQEASGIHFVTKETFPVLCKWIDDFANFQTIKETLPPKDKMLAAAKSMLFWGPKVVKVVKLVFPKFPFLKEKFPTLWNKRDFFVV